MSLNPITSGSPFDGFFRKNLPYFIFENFKGNDLERIEALFSNLEVTFDNIYQKLTNFPNNLDVYNAEAKYLYQLGKLLGVTHIDNDGDLSNYLNSDGTVDTSKITQAAFDARLSTQRMYIATSIARYLLKGTTESIKRLLYAKGHIVNIQELWAEDVINGPFFEYDNSLINIYGDAIFNDISGNVYNDTTYDLISEILVDVPTASLSAVEVWEQNNYGWQYVVCNLGDIYYKTSSTLPTSGSTNTWYELEASSLPVSGDVKKLRILNDSIYVQTRLDNLVVLPYDLTDPNLTENFKIDDGDCFALEFIENSTLVVLDRGDNIEVRDTTTYQKIANSVAKPAGYLTEIDHIIKKKDGEYLIINDDYYSYILLVTNSTYEIYGAPTVYNLQVDPLEDKHEVFSANNNEFTIIKYNSTTQELLNTFILFDESYTMGIATSPIVSAGVFPEVNDMYHYSGKVLILGNNIFGIYDVPDRTMDTYTYVTSGYDYQRVSLLDKFYFQRISGGSIDFAKINGWNSFLTSLYKSHYFDIEVAINESSPPVAEISEAIDLILPLAKPIHTELLNITTVLTNLEATFNEVENQDDFLTTLPTSAGGTEYTISVTANYDGIHPWKRSNNTPLKYENDGADGRPLLYYRETSFNFDIDTTNDELDAIIYENTPEP